MPILAAVEQRARACCAGHDGAHDVLHLQRVLVNARLLTDAERTAGRQVDRFVVEAACWLHDIVNLPKGSGAPGEAARASAAVARDVLARLQVPAEQIDAVAHAIAAHSFSGGLQPRTIEAAIVQDADWLDAMGAIGIARLWVTAAELGSLLYDPHDPAGCARELDDRRYGLDHIQRKLLRLPKTMNTRAGRREAERRATVVGTYRDELLREIGVA